MPHNTLLNSQDWFNNNNEHLSSASSQHQRVSKVSGKTAVINVFSHKCTWRWVNADHHANSNLSPPFPQQSWNYTDTKQAATMLNHGEKHNIYNGEEEKKGSWPVPLTRTVLSRSSRLAATLAFSSLATSNSVVSAVTRRCSSVSKDNKLILFFYLLRMYTHAHTHARMHAHTGAASVAWHLYRHVCQSQATSTHNTESGFWVDTIWLISLAAARLCKIFCAWGQSHKMKQNKQKINCIRHTLFSL